MLWAILRHESGYERWLDTLVTAAAEGPLIISPVAFAELAPSTVDKVGLIRFLSRLAITYQPISPAAAHLEGVTFKLYRKAGGPRQHLVPDFLIAAHAQIHAQRLAAIDRGYLRQWSPNLDVLAPS